jgi:FkbM family methyltransferase
MNHFFDIGANVGQTFDDYLIKTPDYDGWTIWCFEPSPRHLSQLRCKCEGMAVSGRWKIKLCPFGVSDVSGTFKLYEKEDPRGDSVFPQHTVNGRNITDAEYKVEVMATCIGIVTLLYDINPGDEIVIKIDAEGSEYPIVKRIIHALRDFSEPIPKITRMLIEWHGVPDGGDSRLLSQDLEKLGIKVEGWSF